jgi:alpha-L-rhamnosidase
VFDFGKNFSGWPLLQLTSPKANQTIEMLPGEELKANGQVDQSSMISVGLWGNIRYDYTTTDAANQSWHPNFTYSGFRYLQVTGLSSPPLHGTITALQLRADNQPASDFNSSNSLLNQIDSLTRNAEVANMESVMTDCPDREKGPYTGDAMQDITNELNDFDMRAYMRAEVRNFADAQLADGEVPATGPQWIQGDDGTNWGGAIVGIPWTLYQTYGDSATLRTYYPNMQRYIAYVGTHTSGYLLPDSYGLGDWETSDTVSTPVGYMNSYGYYVQVKDLAQIADVLGNTSDEKTYGQLAQNIATAFNAKYLDTAAHSYSTGTQAADALALDAGLVPASQRQPVLNHLLATINADGGLIKVGSVALAPIIRVLHETGNDNVLYRWATSTAYPSYGYILSLGNTTMTENWDGKPNSDGESLDHHFLGGIDAWFTFGLAGIEQEPGSIAYHQPLIKPAVVAGLSHASGDYRSLYGTIESDWNVSGPASSPDGLRMNVAIPDSSPGSVEVPLLGAQRKITEDGRVVWDAGHSAPGVAATVDGGYIAFTGIADQHTFAWTS